MSPGYPPGPLEGNALPFLIGIAVSLFVAVEFRRRRKAKWWLRGIGFGILVVIAAVFDLPFGIVFGAVVLWLVRQ